MQKLNDMRVGPDSLIAVRSNTPIDSFITQVGGILPGSNMMVIGLPGLGKTTLMLNYIANIIETQSKDSATHPHLRVAFISGEMNMIDLEGIIKRYPIISNIPTLLLQDQKVTVSELTDCLSDTYDLLLYDSFSVISDYLKKHLKMKGCEADDYLLDAIMKSAGNGCINIVIGQCTKAGLFLGSMSLKHAMTSMLELKLINGDRTMHFSKNRQGLTDQSISYRLTSNKIEYNFSELNFIKEMAMIASNSDGLTLKDIETLKWIAAHREDVWIS